MSEPPQERHNSEVMNMYVDPDLMIVVAEKVLCMRADGNEYWCISWLRWFWEKEIERAICSVKEGNS
jgi:hypothetical protein